MAPGKHSIVVTHPGFERKELEIVVASGEKRTFELELKRAAAARPREAGSLTVRTIPWSKVYEGSRLIGTTPLAQVPLAAGRHAITFVNPERPTVTRTVVIKPGQEARLSVTLR